MWLVDYLMKLSVAQNIESRMVHNKLGQILKEAAVVRCNVVFRQLPAESEETQKINPEVIESLHRDLNPGLPEYVTGMRTTWL
jgi:hypothetical protein